MTTKESFFFKLYFRVKGDKMKYFSIKLLILGAVLSCSAPEENDQRTPGTYQVYGFQEKVEISTYPKFDSIMAWLDPWLDSLKEQVRPTIDSVLNQVRPTIDSINEEYGWTQIHSMEYNFEIDHKEKIILFHEKGQPHKSYYYQRIEPLGLSRKYVISDIESFIFYGNVDSVLYSLDETLKTLYK